LGQSSKPYIVVTTTLLADAIQNIVKDSAEVVSIMGPGVDPHLYKASLGDLRKFMKADYIFYQGLHLEGKMAEVLEKLGRTKSVTALGNKLPPNLIHQPVVGGNFPDPHIWFDVSLWKEVVLIARDVLIEQKPEAADYYRLNADTYAKELDSLDSYVRSQIHSIPENKRVLITAHDAFSYFGRAYNIEVMGLQGISTQAEFGLRDVSNLVNLIVDRDIQAVFVETSVSDKALRAVVEGVANKKKKVIIGGLLYTDALGAKGTPEGTYTGMITYNVNTITKALK
jgi:manganese/zinc/iron transport system substrate-binding protein